MRKSKIPGQQEVQIGQAEGISRLGEMAAALIHELNNPICIMSVSVDAVISGLKSPGGNSDLLVKNAERIREMIHRVSKIMAGLRAAACDVDREPFVLTPIHRLVRQAVEFDELAAREHQSVQIDLVLPEEEVLFQCRPVEISQVILNLLSNARDAVEGLPGGWIRIEVRRQNQFLFIEVTDNGAGIPGELRPHLMEPFFTTKKSSERMGLGLSLSRRIVESHGGTLRLDETCEQTRFAICLPIH